MTRNLYANVNLKATPINDEHIVNKKYVDQAINKKIVDPVRAAATDEAIDLTSVPNPLTIDHVPLVSGDRVLLLHQTDPTENGIYVLGNDGNLTRATSFETGDNLPPNMMVPVMEGKNNKDVTFVSTNDTSAIIGTDALNFARLNSEEHTTTAKLEFSGDGTASDFTISHNLNTENVQVSIYNKNTKEECQFDIKIVDADTVNVHADIVLDTTDEFIVVVQG